MVHAGTFCRVVSRTGWKELEIMSRPNGRTRFSNPSRTKTAEELVARILLKQSPRHLLGCYVFRSCKMWKHQLQCVFSGLCCSVSGWQNSKMPHLLRAFRPGCLSCRYHAASLVIRKFVDSWIARGLAHRLLREFRCSFLSFERWSTSEPGIRTGTLALTSRIGTVPHLLPMP